VDHSPIFMGNKTITSFDQVSIRFAPNYASKSSDAAGIAEAEAVAIAKKSAVKGVHPEWLSVSE